MTVTPGESIQSAIDNAVSGDTVDVQAGTYTNQFLSIQKSITLQAVGGRVVMNETTSPPNGKAMIVEGVAGTNIAINGFDISGVSVGDNNGAAIRYEGGNLSLTDDYFHNNQEGLLGNSDDPNGTISIEHSEFAFNGDGSGFTHNFYAGNIASVNINNSYFHDAIVGHEIKSRADNTTITNTRIFDNNSNASYSVDDPNGGNLSLTNDVIEQGPNSENQATIAYGEEGRSNPGDTINITSDMLVNDRANGRLFLNPSNAPINFSGNTVFGFVDTANTTDVRPTLDTSSLTFGDVIPVTPPPPPPPIITPPPVTPPPIVPSSEQAFAATFGFENATGLLAQLMAQLFNH